MEWLSLPVYVWSDLRDALGGPLPAIGALTAAACIGWLLMQLIGVYMAAYSRRLQNRDGKLKNLLEVTEAELLDCTRANRTLEGRVKLLEEEAERERTTCRDKLAKHEREIYELRSAVLDLKGRVLEMQWRD